jgi:L-rhamnose mutarotase
MQKTQYAKGKRIIVNEERRKKWKEFIYEYSKYFKSNEEIWIKTLIDVTKYIDDNNQLPPCCSKNIVIKRLGLWIQTQKAQFTKEIHIMKYDIIREKWKEFINKYSKYFKSNEKVWNETFMNVKKYIDENNNLPNRRSNNQVTKRFGLWIRTQKTNYAKRKHIMANGEIRKKWDEFTNECNEYI